VIDFADESRGGECVGDVVLADECRVHFGFAIGVSRMKFEPRSVMEMSLGAIVALAADAKADDTGFAGAGHAVGGGVVAFKIATEEAGSMSKRRAFAAAYFSIDL